jgi:beta-lactamase class A
MLLGYSGQAQQPDLREKLTTIIAKFPGDVGVSVKNLNTGDTLALNGKRRYPMQSVFKFPIALAVFSQVDRGLVTLDKNVSVNKSDYIPNTWSPLAKKFPEGGIEVTVEELLRYMVSESDNNACDILIRLLGKPSSVQDFIELQGIANLKIQYNEAEMHKSWEPQFANWSDPRAMSLLLEKFYKQEILSPESTRLLWTMMVGTTTGSKRLKGLLPPDIVVAHRTGSSGTNEKGLRAAVNDVGIIMLPDGSPVVISVFITRTSESWETCEYLIANISQTVFNHFKSFN